jgi:hypothetical protein
MPCLKAAPASRMNRASSTPIVRMVFWMVGKVPSPTPMMPISLDSIRVMRTPSGRVEPRRRAR